MFALPSPRRLTAAATTAFLLAAALAVPTATATPMPDTVWTFSESEWTGGLPNTAGGFKKILPDAVVVWNNTNANLDCDSDTFNHPDFSGRSLNQSVNTGVYSPNVQWDFTGSEAGQTLEGISAFTLDVQITGDYSTFPVKFYTSKSTITGWPTLTSAGGGKYYGTIDLAEAGVTDPVLMVKTEFYGNGKTTAIAFDNFGYTLVPEPAALSVLAVGACLGLIRRHRRGRLPR